MPCTNEYVASAGAQSASDSFHDAIDDGMYVPPSDCDNEILCWIRQHPIAAIGIALALGLLLGRR